MFEAAGPQTIGNYVPQRGENLIPSTHSLAKNPSYAAAQAAMSLLVEVGSRQHDQWEMARLLVPADLINEFEPVHLRHHQVEENDIGLDKGEAIQANAPVL